MRLKAIVAIYLVGTLVYGGVWLLPALFAHPGSWRLWAMLALVLPVGLLLESVGEETMERHPLMRFAERRTKGRRFSWLRIGAALAAMLPLIAAACGIAWLLR